MAKPSSCMDLLTCMLPTVVTRLRQMSDARDSLTSNIAASHLFFTMAAASFVASSRILLLRQVNTARGLSQTLRYNSRSTENPLAVIQGALQSLDDASSQLTAISETIQAPLLLNSGQQVTFRDIILHTRDAHPNDFHSRAAVEARAQVAPIAESIEKELKQLSSSYIEKVMPQMEQATRICQETPCGGASWEADFSASKKVSVKDTPCGRLSTASVDFLKHTYDTKADVILASRAALIMRLAIEFNAPLTLIRNDGEEEQKSRIQNVFREELVPTPWLRTDEEYKQFFEMEKEFKNDKE